MIRESHLLQMRGLKQLCSFCCILFLVVASFTDAWIETSKGFAMIMTKLSHLLQMRGLKLK